MENSVGLLLPANVSDIGSERRCAVARHLMLEALSLLDATDECDLASATLDLALARLADVYPVDESARLSNRSSAEEFELL